MESTSREDFMNMVAGQLVRYFLTALQNLASEKNYYSHVGSLAEILDWAKDFCQLYEDKFMDAKFSVHARNCVHEDLVLKSLVISFGCERLLTFYRQNAISDDYFIEKYSSLQS
jgi:hypothetical protein